MAQVVKNPPATQETWVQSLGGKDPLEKEMATHSSILAQRIPWTEEPGGLLSHMTEWLTQHTCPWHQESASRRAGMRKVGGLELGGGKTTGWLHVLFKWFLVITPSS